MSEIQTLGGRQYRPIHTSTLEHDIAMMLAVRTAGLGEMTLGEGESPGEFAHRIFISLLESGQAFDVLGCLLIPVEIEDVNWTRAIGEQTAAAMRALTDTDEKRSIQSQMVSMVIGFFQSGLTRLTISPSSLPAEKVSAPARNAATAEPSISETGT